MRHNHVLIAVAGTLSALVLTACGSSAKSGGGSALGGSGSSQGQTVRIGFEGPLSGDYQQLGLNEVNGIQLAVDQANAKNTFGFKVVLVRSDDQGDPSKAPSAAAALIQDQTIVGVVGPAFSGPLKAVGATYSSAGLSFITPSATNASLQTLGFSAYHRVVPSDNVEGTKAGDWLARLKVKKVFIIDDLSDYGKGVGDAVRAEVTAKGVSVAHQGVDSKTTDYTVVAQAVQASKAGAVFYGGYDTQAALLAKALKSVGYTGITVTGNGSKSSVFTQGSGAAGNGWYFTCGCLDAASAPGAAEFSSAYQAAFHEPSSTFSPESFDATNALLTAIKAAKANGQPTRASVATALTQLDYKGIAVEVKFAKNGDLERTAENVYLYQQKNGKISGIGNIDDQK